MDLELKTKQDDYYSSGPGVWIMHDHREHTTTNKGIGPGGDITAIVYQDFQQADGLPKVATSLLPYFDPLYYQAKVPVFDPSIFHSSIEQYNQDVDTEESFGAPKNYPEQKHPISNPPQDDEHFILANSCDKPRSFQRIYLKAGTEFAGKGQVFGFEPKVIKTQRCQEVEIVLENTDSVRHALMIPGLNPMFSLEFRGPDIQVARFVTPDKDITLNFHCHVASHEKMGMLGQLIVGKGGVVEIEHKEHLYQGEGLLLEVDLRSARIVINHKEIKDFMAAMTMSYQVDPAQLLQTIKAGDYVSFTLDAQERVIISITAIDEINK